MQLIPTHNTETPAVELPLAFVGLQPYASTWARDSETGRNIQRHAVSMPDIIAFKDAMLERFDEVVAYLNGRDINALEGPDAVLMQMLLSLAEIAPAVESYGQQAVIDGFDPRRFIAEEDFCMKPPY
jgi:hypothetical protein